MDLEQVRALAQILRENDLSVLELSCGEDKVKLERQSAVPAIPAAPANSAAQIPPAAESAATGAAQNYREIKSPMVGVFYAAPSPDSEPFVKAGSRVKKGDVLCVIEAMKLMNEVNAEQEGTIQEVCVENGQVVEYGQTLFKIV
ncbi:acetyl-CoA carboxylase, biotin carboxyl carrier protein [Clostridium sp. W14A]|nr:acetyl-CoA carboxylase, biotin carboxyl carrier protein [Clostridium sp. W14A]QNK42466.1 acetyl-CoA carboxylase biotin carboxyl carrier protein [Caproicibacter fermentans]